MRQVADAGAVGADRGEVRRDVEVVGVVGVDEPAAVGRPVVLDRECPCRTARSGAARRRRCRRRRAPAAARPRRTRCSSSSGRRATTFGSVAVGAIRRWWAPLRSSLQMASSFVASVKLSNTSPRPSAVNAGWPLQVEPGTPGRSLTPVPSARMTFMPHSVGLSNSNASRRPSGDQSGGHGVAVRVRDLPEPVTVRTHGEESAGCRRRRRRRTRSGRCGRASSPTPARPWRRRQAPRRRAAGGAVVERHGAAPRFSEPAMPGSSSSGPLWPSREPTSGRSLDLAIRPEGYPSRGRRRLTASPSAARLPLRRRGRHRPLGRLLPRRVRRRDRLGVRPVRRDRGGAPVAATGRCCCSPTTGRRASAGCCTPSTTSAAAVRSARAAGAVNVVEVGVPPGPCAIFDDADGNPVGVIEETRAGADGGGVPHPGNDAALRPPWPDSAIST